MNTTPDPTKEPKHTPIPAQEAVKRARDEFAKLETIGCTCYSDPDGACEYCSTSEQVTRSLDDALAAIASSGAEKIEGKLSCALEELLNIENECLGLIRPLHLIEHVGTQTQYGRVAAMRDDLERAREQARQQRDIAEADLRETKKMLAAVRGENLAAIERFGVKEIASKAARSLPPDVLTSPMPFPDRLEYAEAVIARAIIEAINTIKS